MFKALVRTTVSLAAFGVGISVIPREWRKSDPSRSKLTNINETVLNKLKSTEEYKSLEANPSYRMYVNSKVVPEQHHKNYISTGLLFGPSLFEIDPIIFMDESKGELISFHHLGEKLTSTDGQIHNGVISTVLDEGLCAAGFPLLPSKRGVTAKLDIDFKEQAPPDSTVILRARVKSSKGRKVVIEGKLETLPLGSKENKQKPIHIADAECVLVEPKWLKYIKWLRSS